MTQQHPTNAIELHEAEPGLLPVVSIRTDGGTQPRAQTDESVIDDYAEKMREGVKFPAVTIFYDGEAYWLADGFHRVEAAKRAGMTDIAAEVRQGTQRDAILFSVGANDTHGLRRTHADKRRAVERLLRDEEWAAWSDREIARRCAVHHDLVGRVRRELSGGIRQMDDRTVQRNGSTYSMNTGSINADRHWGLTNGTAFWTQVHKFNLDRDTILEQLQPGAKVLTDLRMTRDDCWTRLNQLATARTAEMFPVDSYVKRADGSFGIVKQAHAKFVHVTDLYFNSPNSWEIDKCRPSTEAEYLEWVEQQKAAKKEKAAVQYGTVEDDYQEDVPSMQVEETKDSEYYAQKLKETPWRSETPEGKAEAALGGRGATVRNIFSGQTGTLAFVNGRVAYVDTANGRRQYECANLEAVSTQDIVSELQADIASLDDDDPMRERVQTLIDTNYKRDNKAIRAANENEAQGFDACQTPAYAVDPLLPYLTRIAAIWEPAAGEGLLCEALYDSGFKDVIASDILTGQNFFDYLPEKQWDAIVTNPPFSLKFKWLERCYELGKPFALLLPVETLGTKTAQEMFREHGVEIILMDKRVNFKMPNKGWDGGGAQFPVAWFTWGLDIGQQMTFARVNNVDPE